MKLKTELLFNATAKENQPKTLRENIAWNGAGSAFSYAIGATYCAYRLPTKIKMPTTQLHPYYATPH